MEADEKECPFCAEIIKAKAKVCRYCGRELTAEAIPAPVTNQAESPRPLEIMTIETIGEQMKALGTFDTFFTKKEIKYLPEILRPGETLKAMTSGMLDANTWLITVTDQRVIFLDKGMIWGLKQLEIPLKAITGVILKTGLMFGGINITAASVTHAITMIPKGDVKKVTDTISILVQTVK